MLDEILFCEISQPPHLYNILTWSFVIHIQYLYITATLSQIFFNFRNIFVSVGGGGVLISNIFVYYWE
jgi:hypothetical protein